MYVTYYKSKLTINTIDIENIYYHMNIKLYYNHLNKSTKICKQHNARYNSGVRCMCGSNYSSNQSMNAHCCV